MVLYVVVASVYHMNFSNVVTILSCACMYFESLMLMSDPLMSWWRHQMEISSAVLALCAGNSPVTGEFPTQRPVTLSFDVFFDVRLNKRLSKQSWNWLFETPSRHYDVTALVQRTFHHHLQHHHITIFITISISSVYISHSLLVILSGNSSVN